MGRKCSVAYLFVIVCGMHPSLLIGLVCFSAINAKIYFKEEFSDDDWEKRWIKSKHKDDFGKWEISHGKFYGDAVKIKDAKFYSIGAKFDKGFSNKGKSLVIQFSVKHEQDIDCGGGYVKLMSSNVNLEDFHGETPYNIMFGPDICGPGTKKDDVFTHLYTLIVNSDNTYEVQIDGEKAESGELEADWDFLPPKKIKDPDAKKPEDWDEREFIDDEDDKKPEDWDKPEHIPDPDAKKPEDWDDEMDGEWEPPMVDNPEYKGEWKPKQKKNPAYKGKWIHPEIENPDYAADDNLYVYEDIGAIGFDLWQVKSGTIFDDVIVTDNVEEAKKFAEKTLKITKEGEKKMKEKQDEEEEKKRKEEEEKEKEKEEEEKDEEEKESKGKEEDMKKALEEQIFQKTIFKEQIELAVINSLCREEFEQFKDGDGWKNRWILSEYRNDYGKFNLSYGQFYNDPEEDLGLTTTEDFKNYAISAKFPKFSNKDKPLIIQYAIKRFTLPDEDCGGLYIKDILWDIYDSKNNRNNYSGEIRLLKWWKTISLCVCLEIKDDELSHVYTLILYPNNSIEILADYEQRIAGDLEDHYDFLKPRMILDPNVEKPDDWVDNEFIPDPNDKKPDDWDQPEFILNLDVKKPDDWDEEWDGEWEPPGMINPEYKGKWEPREIKNPAYKGEWIYPEINNPDYVPDPNLYLYDDIGAIGIELWQVNSSTVYDNIIITDSIEEAKKFAALTLNGTRIGEEKMKKEYDEKLEREEEERKKEEEEEKKKEDGKNSKEEQEKQGEIDSNQKQAKEETQVKEEEKGSKPDTSEKEEKELKVKKETKLRKNEEKKLEEDKKERKLSKNMDEKSKRKEDSKEEKLKKKNYKGRGYYLD
ncbi:Calreticulin [Dirofilaria immitis]|nr:Calreticulin [Dirofilaria immitis]